MAARINRGAKFKNGRTVDEFEEIYNALYFKFCRETDIIDQRRRFTMFKAKFLVRLMNMRNTGLMLDMNMMVNDWVNTNIDQLYNSYK